ncbi:MAG: hypothetical protein HC824_00880 [Synechococcales cyanobacterium RM1_1_8]|nr:hypothetical protein [Synechococcales cyanobacterium RM1_1_8]
METAVAFEFCHPRSVLAAAAASNISHVQLSDPAITWHLYFREGQLVYASNSADPFERLERHLRSLAGLLTALDKDVRNEMRSRFSEDGDPQAPGSPTTDLCHDTGLCHDYGAIAWAVQELYIDAISAGTLASKITAEVMEGYIQLPEANYGIKRQVLPQLPIFCTLQIVPFLERVEERLAVWRSLAPHLVSPYQRPYLASKTLARTRLKEDRVNQLSKLLVGFNFRQLGMIVRQDELLFAQRLYPLMADQIILLRSPLFPFDKLPYPRAADSPHPKPPQQPEHQSPRKFPIKSPNQQQP